MDSMRHLSTSLPRARRLDEQSDVLADFKAAAMSVTNLYKTAAVAQDKARAAGYQDAVEDLLAFLDQQNLGLMDGEGWRVRQWATERLVDDGGMKQGAGSEADDAEEERKEEEAAAQPESRSSSPEVQRKTPPMPVDSSDVQEDATQSRRQATSEPPMPPASLPQQPPMSEFSFRSTHAYPTNHDRDGNMDLDASTTVPSTPSTVSTTTPDSTAIRPTPRHSRSGRHTNHGRRNNTSAFTTNSAAIGINLGAGAGSKRKLPYSDFFDISGLNFDSQDGRDQGFESGGGRSGGGGGGKRGRHV